MRISDWSSDVCSSDLPDPRPRPQVLQEQPSAPQKDLRSRAGIGLAQAIRWSWPWIPQALAQPSWQLRACWTDGERKSVVSGKRVSVRVDLGGCRIIKKKIK